MSTRRYLKNRHSFFKSLLKKDSENEKNKAIVEELQFLLEKLKEYELRKI